MDGGIDEWQNGRLDEYMNERMNEKSAITVGLTEVVETAEIFHPLFSTFLHMTCRG